MQLNFSANLGLAKSRHAYEGRVRLYRHYARNDGAGNPPLLALVYVVNEDLNVVEELRYNEVGAGVYLFLEESEVGLYSLPVNVALGVASHGDSKVVPELRPYEPDQLSGILKAVLVRHPRRLTLARIAPQRQDVVHAGVLRGLRDGGAGERVKLKLA